MIDTYVAILAFSAMLGSLWGIFYRWFHHDPIR